MSKELPFMVLCVEEYKNQKGLTGKEVMALFNKYSVCKMAVGIQFKRRSLRICNMTRQEGRHNSLPR